MRAAQPVWRHAGVAALLVVSLAGLAPTQSGHNLERPAHWKARYDDWTDHGERRLVVMRPGWHVYAGPGGLFWDPGSFATGADAVSSTIFLFPEGDPEQSGSTGLGTAYGLFLAGRDLEEDKLGYLLFEIRNDGRFRVLENAGGAIRELVPWSEHDAIATMDAEASGPMKNVLGVDVREDKVVFYVNDTEAAELPDEERALDGVIGIRGGAGLSLQVTEIEIGPNRRE